MKEPITSRTTPHMMKAISSHMTRLIMEPIIMKKYMIQFLHMNQFMKMIQIMTLMISHRIQMKKCLKCLHYEKIWMFNFNVYCPCAKIIYNFTTPQVKVKSRLIMQRYMFPRRLSIKPLPAGQDNGHCDILGTPGETELRTTMQGSKQSKQAKVDLHKVAVCWFLKIVWEDHQCHMQRFSNSKRK